jgi:PAS domain-containing protein
LKEWTLRGIMPARFAVQPAGPEGEGDEPFDSPRVLVDQFPGLIWTTDRDFVFTTILGRALASLGLGPNQLVGMTLGDLFEDPIAGAAAERAHARALFGETLSFRLRLGGRRFQARVAPLADAGGAVIGLIGLAVEAADTHRPVSAPPGARSAARSPGTRAEGSSLPAGGPIRRP